MTIVRTAIRQTVQARFPDGSAYEGPVGTPIEAFIEMVRSQTEGHIVAALMNGKLRELCQPVQADADLVPVTTASSDGSRIYRRSLCFLMIAAASELFPRCTVSILHSMPFGGYYCERDDQRRFTDKELARLKGRMQELIEANLPISPVKVPLDEALQLFLDSDDKEKAALFAKRRKDYLTLYELNGVRDYFHGFMVPHTCYLDVFDLRQYNRGFILQFPRRQQPDVLQPFVDEPRLVQVFREYQDWLRIMGIPKVATLNEAIRNGRAQELILVAEALHERQLANMASQIAHRRPQLKVVLISGPTSAGKTTLSKRLAIQLMARGIYPVAIGMDNYFVNRDETPRDEKGDYDYETIDALDVDLFRKHMWQLMAGQTIVQPVYNFHTGRRELGEPLSIGPDHVVLVEGIHGLNPRMIEGLDMGAVYRVFISAFTQLNLDKHNRVPTTDTRLLRRIVRDAAHRG
jgi:uridine kinase